MRVYFPATLPQLRNALVSREFDPISGIGFAVTDALRREYAGSDDEQLDDLALHDAALASLRLIADSGAEPARVVLQIDVDDGTGASGQRVSERGDADRAAAEVSGTLGWEHVVCVHIDGGDAAEVVAAAADVVDAADLGDPDAEITVGDVEEVDLARYAPHEMDYLISELGP